MDSHFPTQQHHFFVSGIATVVLETYEVKSGVLYQNCAKHFSRKYCTYNNLTNEDLIYAGQIIELGERSKIYD